MEVRWYFGTYSRTLSVYMSGPTRLGGYKRLWRSAEEGPQLFIFRTSLLSGPSTNPFAYWLRRKKAWAKASSSLSWTCQAYDHFREICPRHPPRAPLLEYGDTWLWEDLSPHFVTYQVYELEICFKISWIYNQKSYLLCIAYCNTHMKCFTTRWSRLSLDLVLVSGCCHQWCCPLWADPILMFSDS